MYGYIYKTTNLVNGKIYIGQKHSEKFLGNSYLGSGKLLRRALGEYGKENFTIEILEEIPSKTLMDEREIYWINYYNSTNKDIGYNISEGGNVNRTMVGENNPFYGKTHSKEAMEKIINANLGKIPWNKGLTKDTDERVNNYAKLQKGKHYVKGRIWVNKNNTSKMIKEEELTSYLSLGWEEGRILEVPESFKTIAKNRRRINNGALEKLVNEDELDYYLSNNWKLGRIKFKDTSNFGKHTRRKVLCVETGIIFDSPLQVKQQLGINCYGCCKGNRKTAGGYHWRYIDEKVN